MIDPSFYEFNQSVAQRVLSFIERRFQDANIVIEPLAGGRSISKNFILNVEGKSYILRLQNPAQSLLNSHRELFAFHQAAKVGVAPEVYFVSPDFSFALVERVNGGTSTIAQAKNPENWEGIAYSFRTLHQLPKNPYLRASKVEIFSTICGEKEEFRAAKKKLEFNDLKIRNYGDHSVTIHGDPHPRNLFFQEGGKLRAVDWEDTNWDDPFYDISFFSLLHLFDEEEEQRFLRHYLKEASKDQMGRYYLCKENSLLFLAILCIDQSYDLALEQNVLLNERPLERWSSYVMKWADSSDHPPQFFYDWGKASLKLVLGK